MNKENNDKILQELAGSTLKIKVNYSEKNLQNLARKRSKYASHNNLHEYFNKYYQSNVNQVFEMEDTGEKKSEKSDQKKEEIFENSVYMNHHDFERIEEIDDECIKIDIENLNFTNQTYDLTDLNNNENVQKRKSESNATLVEIPEEDEHTSEGYEKFEIILNNFDNNVDFYLS